jgi:hypothetical protein
VHVLLVEDIVRRFSISPGQRARETKRNAPLRVKYIFYQCRAAGNSIFSPRVILNCKSKQLGCGG